ncbi:MAG: PhnD/SsuA/transferrin family substrate-binding protein [Bryobacterales bacterium]|nr:PhnD/SsuA/transferrin family substrate-binding protein [Bryobacterales bacterium]
MVPDLNIHDARAAMQVWLRRMGNDLHMRLDSVPQVFDRFDRIAAKLRQGELEAVGCNILEYRQLARWLNKSWVVVPLQKTPLSYVLLSRTAAGGKGLADLKGKRLMLLASPNACLAPAWLTNLLHRDRHGESAQFFSEVARKSKAPQVILPVFFGQADACLATNDGFRTLCELNPQVAVRLRLVAASTEVVPMVYAFGEHVNAEALDRTLRVLADVPGSAAGRQVLTLFQYDRLEARSIDVLHGSLAMLAQAERVAHATGNSND